MNFLTKLFGKKDTKTAAEAAPAEAAGAPASVHLLESVQAPADPPASDSPVEDAPEQASVGD